MARFLLNYTFSDNSYLEEQACGTFKYWKGEGLPDYEGTFEGFAEAYPDKVACLVRRKIIKTTE